MEYTRICVTCGKELNYTNEQQFNNANNNNTKCRSCCHKKLEYPTSLSVTCKCGKETEYSNKYNANSARARNRCASCARSEANVKLWEDESFRERRGKAATERWNIFWKEPLNREKASSRTSIRNIERWKDETYRDFMYEKLRLCPSKGVYGIYNGNYFRSTLELRYMIEILHDTEWVSGESRKFAIKYFWNDKYRVYYPDFVIGNRIVEIKPHYQMIEPSVIAKAEAAKLWCLERGYTYEIIDPGGYTIKEVMDMHINKIIELKSKKLLDAITQKLQTELHSTK